jgi:hypothetical protein
MVLHRPWDRARKRDPIAAIHQVKQTDLSA